MTTAWKDQARRELARSEELAAAAAKAQADLDRAREAKRTADRALTAGDRRHRLEAAGLTAAAELVDQGPALEREQGAAVDAAWAAFVDAVHGPASAWHDVRAAYAGWLEAKASAWILAHRVAEARTAIAQHDGRGGPAATPSPIAYGTPPFGEVLERAMAERLPAVTWDVVAERLAGATDA